jgi:hypothetical protein
MQGPGEEKKQEEDSVIEGEDAERAAGVEGLEEVRDVKSVEQNASDEEAGEDEEEIDADVRGCADLVQEIEEAGAGLWIRPEKVAVEDEEDSETANPIERRDMSEATGVLGIVGLLGCKGGSAMHV